MRHFANYSIFKGKWHACNGERQGEKKTQHSKTTTLVKEHCAEACR